MCATERCRARTGELLCAGTGAARLQACSSTLITAAILRASTAQVIGTAVRSGLWVLTVSSTDCLLSWQHPQHSLLSHSPENPAVLPNGASPEGASEGAPGGWQPSWDKRPAGQMCFKSSQERHDANSGGGSSGSNNGNKGGGGSSSASASASGSASASASAYAGSNSGGSGSRSQFPSNSLLSGWLSITSKMDPWSATAPDGRSAYCGTLDGYGRLMFKVTVPRARQPLTILC